jgi:hypothetical protein
VCVCVIALRLLQAIKHAESQGLVTGAINSRDSLDAEITYARARLAVPVRYQCLCVCVRFVCGVLTCKLSQLASCGQSDASALARKLLELVRASCVAATPASTPAVARTSSAVALAHALPTPPPPPPPPTQPATSAQSTAVVVASAPFALSYEESAAGDDSVRERQLISAALGLLAALLPTERALVSERLALVVLVSRARVQVPALLASPATGAWLDSVLLRTADAGARCCVAVGLYQLTVQVGVYAGRVM